MAKGRKTGGRDFKKGKSGGPGRPKLSLEKKMERKALLDYYKSYIEEGLDLGFKPRFDRGLA